MMTNLCVPCSSSRYSSRQPSSHEFPIQTYVLLRMLLKSGFLIFTHEATVSFYICTEDGCEFTFYFLGGYGILQGLVGRWNQTP